ncbi:MAG: enoyl-CoA hydratase-related protein [Giesbergeria sp.]
MTDLVSYAFADGVATLTMDDGKANAMGPAMQAALNAALDRAEADKAIVVLTGRPGVFSGGFDLSVFKAGDPAGNVPDAHRWRTTGQAGAVVSAPGDRRLLGPCDGHGPVLVAVRGCAHRLERRGDIPGQ